MAFQDNSGDIILDVVLTDEGRRRLARGDNSFSIVKFALGDDEINYELFDTSSTTALQDLSILQTPVLEAFTNNTSLMKSKLISLANANLLYLPVLKLNTISPGAQQVLNDDNFVVCVDKNTFDDRYKNGTRAIGYSGANRNDGFLYGLDTGTMGGFIRVDSGIDSTDVTEIDESLIETSFIVEMDSRLGQIISVDGTEIPGSSIDDDLVATYSFTRRPGSSFIVTANQDNFEDSDTVIDGPVASFFQFKIRSSQDLRTSNFLFNRIGSSISTKYKNRGGTNVPDVLFIDSVIRVTGRTTGYSVDIPVRFVKV
tara:strand:- start:1291 stop:2229 length:939 start_codon:yes stop_codon:yes gene_type:complete